VWRMCKEWVSSVIRWSPPSWSNKGPNDDSFWNSGKNSLELMTEAGPSTLDL
jgi:hypothetical protein